MLLIQSHSRGRLTNQRVLAIVGSWLVRRTHSNDGHDFGGLTASNRRFRFLNSWLIYYEVKRQGRFVSEYQ